MMDIDPVSVQSFEAGVNMGICLRPILVAFRWRLADKTAILANIVSQHQRAITTIPEDLKCWRMFLFGHVSIFDIP